MHTRFLATLAVAGLALAACGNDAGDVADKFIEDAEAAGMDVDE